MIAGLFLGCDQAIASNLFTNGDFEGGTYAETFGSSTDNLPNGWTNSPPTFDSNLNVFANGSGPGTAESGTHYIAFQSAVTDGTQDCLNQVISTVPNQKYTISFWVAMTASPGSQFGLSPEWDAGGANDTTMGTTAFYYHPSDAPETPWTFFSFIETASSSSTSIYFHGADATGAVLLDNVTVVPAITPTFSIGQFTTLLKDGSSNVAGLLRLTVTGTGGFTGSLTLNGTTYPVSGGFSHSTLGAVINIKHGKLSPTVVTLTYTDVNGANVYASVSANGSTYTGDTGPPDPYTLKQRTLNAGVYTAIFSQPTQPVGTAATASAVVANGNITQINVSSDGAGYTAPPHVSITAPTGSGAIAFSQISGGAVTDIPVIKSGSKYPASGVVVTIDDPKEGVPAGIGYALMTVGGAGSVKIVGKLNDGSAFSSSSSLNHNGVADTVAFYLPLYNGVSKVNAPGSLSGTLTFEDNGGSDCDGSLAWVKPAQTAGAFYPGGFNVATDFSACRFTPAAKGQVLIFMNKTSGAATFDLLDGNVVNGAITHNATVSATNAVKITDPTSDKLTLTIGAKTGLLFGSFKNLGGGVESAISGVVYQKTNFGYGLFKGAWLTGNFVLTPE